MRLTQAILNLTNNAIKFTDTGNVTVSCRIVEANPHDLLLRFEVKDSGIGIAEETLAKLFSPFTQGDDSITRKHGGTGLGLVITRQLAELMGGEAGAQSTPGLGSTFWFTARLSIRALELAAVPCPAPNQFSAIDELIARHSGCLLYTSRCV